MSVARILSGSLLRPVSRSVSQRRFLALIVAVASGVSVMGTTLSASAQDMGDMADRLQRLEREISVLQRQTGNGVAVPAGGASTPVAGDTASQLMLRIGELERQVAELTGRVEEVQHAVSRVNARIDNISKDMDDRLLQLEQGGGAMGAGGQPGTTQPGAAPSATSATAPGSPTAGGTAGGARSGQPGVLGTMPQSAAAQANTGAGAKVALPAGSPEQQYNYASTLLRNGDYAGAQLALEAFIKQNPTHDLAGNAQYWLGETFYVRQDYKSAAVAFLDGYRTYPKNSKAADNLLKLGLSMSALNQTKEACAALGRIAKEYPTATDVTKRRAQSERDRLKCPKG